MARAAVKTLLKPSGTLTDAPRRYLRLAEGARSRDAVDERRQIVDALVGQIHDRQRSPSHQRRGIGVLRAQCRPLGDVVVDAWATAPRC
jgi:hypothetical protein